MSTSMKMRIHKPVVPNTSVAHRRYLEPSLPIFSHERTVASEATSKLQTESILKALEAKA